MRSITYGDAIVEAIAEEMRRDDKIFHLSTEPPPQLLEEFGDERVRHTPITESALTGMAIGAGIFLCRRGWRQDVRRQDCCHRDRTESGKNE